MAKQVDIGSVTQIPPGEGRNFVVDAQQVAVFRTHGGEIYATQASCPHRGGPLADGLLGGATIVCPLHDRIFDLRNGEELSANCVALKTYPVALVDGDKIVISV
jgi:nitrite reductase (NADH) small subunit